MEIWYIDLVVNFLNIFELENNRMEMVTRTSL